MVFSYWSRVRMSPSVLLLICIRCFGLCNTTSSVHNKSMVLFLFRELTSYFLSNFSRMKLCVGFCSSCNSKLFWLMLFEPLSIAFESLQSIMVHGFQLLDIWQRHLMDSGVDYLDFQKTYKQAAGSFSEWRGQLIRNFGFVIDLISLLMSLGHYSMIFWLRGMAFHLVDAVLLLNLRALVVSFLKRIKTYIKLRKALRSLDGALPDAKYDEICTYDDECAICRGPMARAKKLPCNHLFHLPCLRSWCWIKD
uniref:Zinc finger C3HC4 RING-type domain-containing protein n=1 Tax=Aegilops tauschii subsp. strangulata TaxID=200361 RepID=A0A453BIX0_AEGTS